ncbi:hypothetical protein OG741_01835 [Streptomyces sp. NBC_01410]|uniref:hypothetical protein n=1 Tax=Streptomyces sp. NBC_01410 TaxID=2903856 RepID=UPI00324D2669
MGTNARIPGWRRVATALLGALALLVSMVAGAGTARAAEESALPGGKSNWVVSVGGLDTPTDASDNDSWVRLGTYVFGTDGKVTTKYWAWHQSQEPMRKNALKTDCGGDLPGCWVRTVDGYEAGNEPTEGFRGIYSVQGGILDVTWQEDINGTRLDQDLTERWAIGTGLAKDGVARISSPTFYEYNGATFNTNVTVPQKGTPGAFSNYSATFGIGYGSNYSLQSDSRVPMSTLLSDQEYRKQKYRGAFVRVNGLAVGREGTGGDWTFSGQDTDETGDPETKAENPADPWRKCTSAECIGFLQTGTSCHKQEDDGDRVRYIAELGSGRRNLEEYWCQGLAGVNNTECYQWNSHARPMLQVIDDSGRFQGWVGVEPFTHVSTQTGTGDQAWTSGYWGVFDMVSMSQLKPTIPPTLPARTFSKFDIPYGNSYASGHLIWDALNRKVSWLGHNRVYSDCRYMEFTSWTAGGTKQVTASPRWCIGDSDTPPLLPNGKPDGKPNNNIWKSNGTHTFPSAAPNRVQVTYWAAGSKEGVAVPVGTMECTPQLGRCVPATRDGWPITGFRLTHGASIGAGAITWYNESADISGNNHVASGCRYIELTGRAADGSVQRKTTSPWCSSSGADRAFGPTKVDFSSQGVALSSIMVTYWASDEGDHSYATKMTQICTRAGCTTDNDARYPETQFQVAHGASATTGSITWYYQSADVSGNNHVASGCRYAEIVATAADGSVQKRTTSPLCSSTGGNLAFGPEKFDFPGVESGIARFVITYWASEDGGLTYATKEVQLCTRGGCVSDSTARDGVTEFRVTYGASVGSGSVTWVNRSVTVQGNNHVASGCRYVEIIGTGADGSTRRVTSSPYCSAGDRPFGGTQAYVLDFSQVDNGASSVRVNYWADDGGGYTVKDTAVCTRTGGCV